MAKSLCIYGPSGSFKTSQIKYFARYIAEKTGKATLLISTDGGGWAPCEPEIRAGMIRPYSVELSTLPMFILRKLSQGYWPENPEETEPEKINMRRIDFAEVGGIAVEGWTSISGCLMRYLPDKGINVGGEERAKLGGFSQAAYVEGQLVTEHFRSNTRGDYGHVPKDLYAYVMSFKSLPVEYVLHTALESRGKDEDGKVTYGPAIAGQKATGQCQQWVGDLIHAQDCTVTREVDSPDPKGTGTVKVTVAEPVVRYYFRKMLDAETGIPYPAKPRVAPERVREMEKRFPGGYFEPKIDGRDCLDTYLREVERWADDASKDEALKDWRIRTRERLTGQKTARESTQPATVSSTK